MIPFYSQRHSGQAPGSLKLTDQLRPCREERERKNIDSLQMLVCHPMTSNRRRIRLSRRS